MRAGFRDGHGPFVASDIPIEFVMVIKKTKRVRDSVFDRNSAGAVIGVGNVDFQFEILAFAARFISELVSISVGDAFHVQKERVVQATRPRILHRDHSVDAVPRPADELKGDVLCDVD